MSALTLQSPAPGYGAAAYRPAAASRGLGRARGKISAVASAAGRFCGGAEARFMASGLQVASLARDLFSSITWAYETSKAAARLAGKGMRRLAALRASLGGCGLALIGFSVPFALKNTYEAVKGLAGALRRGDKEAAADGALGLCDEVGGLVGSAEGAGLCLEGMGVIAGQAASWIPVLSAIGIAFNGVALVHAGIKLGQGFALQRRLSKLVVRGDSVATFDAVKGFLQDKLSDGQVQKHYGQSADWLRERLDALDGAAGAAPDDARAAEALKVLSRRLSLSQWSLGLAMTVRSVLIAGAACLFIPPATGAAPFLFIAAALLGLGKLAFDKLADRHFEKRMTALGLG